MKTCFFFLLAILMPCAADATVTVGGVLVDASDGAYLNFVRYMTVPFIAQTGAVWNAGNDVSKKTPAQVHSIVIAIQALETDPIQKEIFTKMNATQLEAFNFRDIPHAQSVVTQRLETISMMQKFNQDGRYDYNSEAHPASTTASDWQTGLKTRFYFRQKSGSAYDAIAQLCDPLSKTYGECLGAIMACTWWGASQGMSQSAFNSLYPGNTALNMDFRVSASPNRNLLAAADTSTLVPGDLVYFQDYNYNAVLKIQEFYKKGWLKATSIYYWSGENALYFGNNNYRGLGVPSQSASQMRDDIARAYNDDLQTVITKLAPAGGIYHSAAGDLEIKAITPAAEPIKIQIVNIRRVTN
jgi:hypothetical protein